jgi:hypothetical protein
MKGEDMVFNIKRVFVAMICAVFIFGFSMAFTVTADAKFKKEPKKDRMVTIKINLKNGTWKTDPDIPRMDLEDRHKPLTDEVAFVIYKCKKKSTRANPCDWVYYIQIGNDVYEIKGNDPDCDPEG